MSNLDIAKEVIKIYFRQAALGIFNSRNWTGDEMVRIYENGELQIDICYYYEYFEVFGLSPEDFESLSEYYSSLVEEMEE